MASATRADAMLIQDGSTTNPALLNRVRDWRDQPAWGEFFQRYDSLLDRWCRRQSLDGAAADEVRQRVWIELSRSIQAFRYDPSKTFRGWLQELCRRRSIDYVRSRRRESQMRELDEHVANFAMEAPDQFELDGPETADCDPIREDLLRAVNAVQVAVQKRVSLTSWDVYQQIALMERPIKEVAADLGISYAAAFQTHQRVKRYLLEEARQRFGQLFPSEPGSDR